MYYIMAKISSCYAFLPFKILVTENLSQAKYQIEENKWRPYYGRLYVIRLGLGASSNKIQSKL